MSFFKEKKTSSFLIIATILSFGGCYCLLAQNPVKNQKFIQYSTRMGLLSSTQYCIAQDKEGFIWIATTCGLSRFDGHSFKEYLNNHDDTTSLRTNAINTLFVDSKGTLWVGTDGGGLSKYNKEHDNFTNYYHKPDQNYTRTDNIISAITEDRQHRIWFSTYNGLNLFNQEKNSITRYSSTDKFTNKTLAHRQIRSLAMDGDNLWIGYAEGLLSVMNIASGKFIHYKLFDMSEQNCIDCYLTSICVDGDSLWISTWGNGTWIFNKKSAKVRHFEKATYKFVNFICRDNNNHLWIGTESDGLLLFDEKRQITTAFKHDEYDKNSISNDHISHIFQDKQGNLWLCSKWGDVNYLELGNSFQTYRKNPNYFFDLTENDITCLAEDKNHYLWVGHSTRGIDIFDKKKPCGKINIAANSKTGLGEGNVNTMYLSRNGSMWVGTYLNGLKRYNEKNGRFTTYKHDPANENSIAGNDVRKIMEDNEGNLWIATHGYGLDKLDLRSGKFEHHKVNYKHNSASINNDWIFNVFFDNEDNIWVGSVAGISFISKKTGNVRHFVYDPANKSGLSNNTVTIIFQDSKGMLWFGTNDGLNKFDAKTNSFKVYAAKDGLPNSVIVGILEDNHYNLWISTSKGLTRFSPEKKTFKNYFVEDGLETDEFRVNSCFKNCSGEMYFGGRDGLNVFNPDSIHINQFKSPVYITDFKLFNQSVMVGNKNNPGSYIPDKQISFVDLITLSYNQNVISFDFVALNYINSQKNQYSYFMEGVDKNWSSPGTKREVTYANLNPGTYTFKVRASNNDGVWNEKEAFVKIVINPPFWKTKWAYALYLLSIIAALYAFRKIILREAKMKRKLENEMLEIEKLQEMDMQKMNFFSNISHEFRTPLTLIIGPLEKIIKTTTNELQLLQLKLIYRNTQRLLRLINQLMDFRKGETDGLKLEITETDLIKFIKELTNAFILESQQRHINFNFIPDVNALVVWFDRDKLDKILFNIIANAFKFTEEGGSVIIRILNENEENQRFVKIMVEDTGRGIPKESLSKIFDRFYREENQDHICGTGIGLSFAKELIQIHGGEIQVESQIGVGSKFTVVLPINSGHFNNLPFTLPRKNNDKEKDSEAALWECEELSMLDDPQKNEHLPLLLIIEDNPDMRLYIKNVFYKTYRIIEASNGSLGIEKAFSEIPDVIISDVVMPGIDGVKLCRILKTDEQTSHIPIVLLTARSAEEIVLKGLGNGADDYILKPFNSSILKIKIKNLLESRRILQKRFLKEPNASIKDVSPTLIDETFLNKAYSVVEQNLNNGDFEANDFALAIGMSRAQLYRKISAVSGQSVKEFIRIIRLKKAAEMLVQTSQNVSEVAFKVGFNSVAYFTKSFSEYFGVSPSNYSSRNRQKKSSQEV